MHLLAEHHRPEAGGGGQGGPGSRHPPDRRPARSARPARKGGIPEGAYTTLAEAEGKVLTTARVAGDPITAYVAGESTAAGIPAQLAPNSVAISIKVDQATGPGRRAASRADRDRDRDCGPEPHPAEHAAIPLQPGPGITDSTRARSDTDARASHPDPAAAHFHGGPDRHHRPEGAGGAAVLPLRRSAGRERRNGPLLLCPHHDQHAAEQRHPARSAGDAGGDRAGRAGQPRQNSWRSSTRRRSSTWRSNRRTVCTIRVEALPAVDLAELYEGMTGYELNPLI